MASFFYFLKVQSKIGVCITHRCALYTAKYGIVAQASSWKCASRSIEDVWFSSQFLSCAIPKYQYYFSLSRSFHITIWSNTFLMWLMWEIQPWKLIYCKISKIGFTLFNGPHNNCDFVIKLWFCDKCDFVTVKYQISTYCVIVSYGWPTQKFSQCCNW